MAALLWKYLRGAVVGEVPLGKAVDGEEGVGATAVDKAWNGLRQILFPWAWLRR